MPVQKSSSRHRPWQNPLKAKLARGEPVVGVVITLNSAEVAVRAATAGFDFLWLEMEHAPVTLDTVRNVVLATRGLPAVTLARPPVNELWTAKRLLDAGVFGVIFPFTSTPQLARQAVAACRYPPVGSRGSGADLARVCWPDPDYYDSADRNVLVVAVVEEVCALGHIDEIAATPGLDVIFIGTSDLSFSLGLRGEQNHPKLNEAIARIAKAGKKNKKALGRPARSAGDIKRFQRQGFQFFMTATDLELMDAGAAKLLAPLGRTKRSATSGGI